MRPDLNRVPPAYHNYINQVSENDLMKAITKQTPALFKFLEDIPADKRDFRYAPGKWTIKEVLQHIIDGERIFSYRGLCFARKDTTPLPSFDENDYADNAKVDKRKWEDLVEELKAVRRSTEIMFDSFDEDQMESTGNASGHSNYTRAIGFIIVGHANHHIRVTKERYL
jgi:uncharacterized damage-inducible protein DinB